MNTNFISAVIFSLLNISILHAETIYDFKIRVDTRLVDDIQMAKARLVDKSFRVALMGADATIAEKTTGRNDGAFPVISLSGMFAVEKTTWLSLALERINIDMKALAHFPIYEDAGYYSLVLYKVKLTEKTSKKWGQSIIARMEQRVKYNAAASQFSFNIRDNYLLFTPLSPKNGSNYTVVTQSDPVFWTTSLEGNDGSITADDDLIGSMGQKLTDVISLNNSKESFPDLHQTLSEHYKGWSMTWAKAVEIEIGKHGTLEKEASEDGQSLVTGKIDLDEPSSNTKSGIRLIERMDNAEGDDFQIAPTPK